MKENRKLLKEVIRGIKRDMTDEEVLLLIADSWALTAPKGRLKREETR